MTKYKHIFMILFSIFALMVFTVDSVYSRGARGARGSGANISRRGPAHTGSMNRSRAYRSNPSYTSRSSNRVQRQETRRTTTQDRQTNRITNSEDRRTDRGDRRDDRYDNRDDVRDDRQDFRDDTRDDWQDYYDDDRYGYRYGRYYYDDDDWLEVFAAGAAIAVGTAVAISAFQSTSCPTDTTSFDGIVYYKCGSTWYTKGYQSGDVVYIASDPPTGY